MAIQLIINKEWGLATNENPNQGSFIIEELTDLVEEAVLKEFEAISSRGGVLGAMETGYQRGKIQEESMLYEHRKHDGSYPIIGVNTFRSPAAGEAPPKLELIRSSEAEKQSQLKRLRAFQEKNSSLAKAMLERLRQAVINDENVFDVLMDAVRDLPGTVLLLVGDGSARAALELHARDAGVADRVVFAGAEPHAREALCAMDILASPSEQETFGLAILEGLAAGLPVLYTTCPPMENVEVVNAHRVPADAAHFREAIARELSTLDRYPVPNVVTTHDIKRSAETISELYAATGEGR